MKFFLMTAHTLQIIIFLYLLQSVRAQSINDIPGLSDSAKNSLVAHYCGSMGLVSSNNSNTGLDTNLAEWGPVDGNGDVIQEFGLKVMGNNDGSAISLSGDSPIRKIFFTDPTPTNTLRLEGPIPNLENGAENYTIFWRGHYDSSPDSFEDAGRYAYNIGANNVSHQRDEIPGSSPRRFQIELFNSTGNNNAGDDITVYDDRDTVWTTVVEGASHQAFANGNNLNVSGAAVAIEANPTMVLSSFNQNGFDFIGEMQDLIIFKSALSDRDRALVRAFLSPLVVTSTFDSGIGSLRDALEDTSSERSIIFDPALSGETIILNGEELLIDKSLVIDASNLPNGITINANQRSSVMQIAPGSNVELNSLTLTGGLANTDSPQDGRGGGIFANSSGTNSIRLSLENCTLFRNSANSFGGGIYFNGRSLSRGLSLDNCTLTGNFSEFRGAAIALDNSTAGGVLLDLTHCTLANNLLPFAGSAISVRATSGEARVSLENSILHVLPSSRNSALVVSGNVSITTRGTNFLTSRLGTPIGNNVSLVTGDPLLTPLGYFGGPVMTMHPLAGSPLVRPNLSSTTRTDQRGFTITGPPTIGAVKHGRVTQVEDAQSLRNALIAASGSQGQVIRFRFGPMDEPMLLSGSELMIPSNVNGLFIDGSSLPNGLSIDARQQSRVMRILADSTVALHRIAMRGGSAPSLEGGGAILLTGGDTGRLSLSDCTLAGNSAQSGGAILSSATDSGNVRLSLSACTLSGNTAAGVGGGISSQGGSRGGASLSLEGCTVSGNSAVFGGGIISNGRVGSAELSLHNTILAGNSATSSGPDLEESFSRTALVSGSNLLTSLDGQSSLTTETAGLIIGDPLLAPLGDYGGGMQTMPPFPESPAVDAAGPTEPRSTDQRGFPRFSGDGLDIGAAEFQGLPDLLGYAFERDSDSDGSSNGVEIAIGSDFLDSNSDVERNLQFAISNDGLPRFIFGYDSNRQQDIILRLVRSTDLISFDHVVASSENGSFGTLGMDLLMLEDSDRPEGGRAFYRLEAEPNNE